MNVIIVDDSIEHCIMEYALLLTRMSETDLCQEYMEMMADRKSNIEKTQIKHEMAKRFFKKWAINKLKK